MADEIEVQEAEPQLEVEVAAEPDQHEEVPQEKLEELERNSRNRLESKVINPETWLPEDRPALNDPAVKNRIDVLTLQKQQAIRQADYAKQQAEAAIQYAQAIQQQNQWLASQSVQAQTAWQQSALRQKEAEIAQVRNTYIEAHGLNDPAKMAEAQEQLASLAAQRQQLAAWQAPQVQAAPPPPQFAPQPAGPSEQALTWKQRNPWFQGVGANDPATVYALAVSNHLISNGVVPDTEDYFRQIDREMQRRFPEVVQATVTTQDQQVSKQPVIAAPRQAPVGARPNKITLTKAQADTAKRMNVPLDVYARTLRDLGEA